MTEPHALRIRLAQPREGTALRDLVLAAYDDYRQVLPRAFWDAYQAAIREQMEQPTTAKRIVAEVGGSLGGVVSLYLTPAAGYGNAESVAGTTAQPVPEIRLLAVDPAWRGQGIGRALVEACIQRAQQDGAPAVGLHTMDVMAVAQRLYEQMGFIRTPATDFTAGAGILIKGYRLDFAHPANGNSR